jgi:hypothetical protein
MRSFTVDIGLPAEAPTEGESSDKVAPEKSLVGSEGVPLTVASVLTFAICILVPRVSGRKTIKNIVSNTRRIKVKIAGIA